MTWTCDACTYANISETRKNCLACDTPRQGGGSSISQKSSIIDLTDICSPKPPVPSSSNRNKKATNGGDDNRHGDVMESNRSRRRRRLMEEETTSGRVDINGHTSHGGSITRNGEDKNKGEEKNSSTDDDIIVDPLPRKKKIPLNNNNSNYHDEKMSSTAEVQKQKKESKLKKKRKVADANNMMNAEGDWGSKKQSSSTTNSESRLTNFFSTQEADANNMMNAEGDWGSKKQSSSTTSSESRLTNFFSTQKQPQLSAEDLMKSVNVILKQTFKHNSLRPLQELAVKAALQRQSSIVIMATGGGKSICYQLPALVAGGSAVTIVVCPLIALMIDQVNNLHRKGVMTAAYLSSSQSSKTKQEILNRLQADNAKKGTKKNQPNNGTLHTPINILYCTPELIQTDRFRTILTNLYRSDRLHMVAVDEAHCLSTWGHDFRPSYRKLAWLRDSFPDVPIMSCTGTATTKVVADIREILQLDRSVPTIMGTFNRPNISYEVRFKDSLNATKPQGALMDVVAEVKRQHDATKNLPCSGIIYVHKREDCESLAKQISKATGLVCLSYHAGLKDAEREATQRKWTEGTCKVAVATVAFGMGIDLPHVRYVIHWTMAKSLDGFYQESGRGGRDGKQAASICYYSKDDADKFAFLVKINAEKAAKKKGNQHAIASRQIDHSLVELEGMVSYCIKPTCKRKHVLGHFGENIDVTNVVCNKTCDYCIDPKKVERDIQASECMSAVVNSHRLLHAGKNEQYKGQKFHHNPLADEESLEDDGSDDFLGGDDGLLGITDCAGADELPSNPMPKGGFMKASSVLGKYEKMECEEGKANGFVTFKTRIFDEPTQEDIDSKKQRAVNIPQHLRKNLPDPFAAKQAAGKKAELKSSSAHASDSNRLKKELEELEKQKAAALAILSSRGGSSKGLPTPSLSFKKR